MRVVVVTTSFPKTDDDPSGHFVRSHARALAREGNEVHVVAPGGSLLEPPQQRGPLVVHRAGGGALFAWPGAAARAREAPWRLGGGASFLVGALARLRALGHVDHVVAHWIVPCAWPLVVMADLRSSTDPSLEPGPGAGRPALDVHAHGADVRALCAAPAGLRARVLRTLVARGARFVFAARALLESLETALDAGTARTLAAVSHVEPPPVDMPDVTASSAALRASLGMAESERLAVVACRLVAPKRVDLAIDAAARVPGLRLVVVGDGPERKSLEQRARGVTFTGALPRREAVAWLGAADVVVHPSAIEAAPSVVREARALGVSVVACDAGDVAAWAEDDAGIRVAAPTADALAAAILAALQG